MRNPDSTASAREVILLRRRVEALGSIEAAARAMGVCRDSLLRVLAGTPVRNGTMHILRAYLQEMHVSNKQKRRKLQ